MDIKTQGLCTADIDWSIEAAPPLTANTAIVWRVPIGSFQTLYSAWGNILHAEEIKRSVRYFHQGDAKRYLIGKMALRLLTGRHLNVPPRELYFYKGTYGKPYLRSESGKQIHFNVSHSGKWVLIGLSQSEIGIDIERVKTAFEYTSLLESCFSSAETAYIGADSNRSLYNFFLLWTRKEAVLKQTGLGLNGQRLKSFTVLSDQPTAGIRIQSFNIHAQYIGSLCYFSHIHHIYYRQFCLSHLKFQS